MTVCFTNPIQDPRWAELVARHPRASVFHTPAWLSALRLTYGYEPRVATTSTAGALTNGVVVCEINSRVTGRRLVSAPFADHCEPLADCAEELRTLVSGLQHEVESGKGQFVEFRPRTAALSGAARLEIDSTYSVHELDLRPGLQTIYRSFHLNCIQRKIRRAEAESLTYENGGSADALMEFYRLLVLTRRRHRLLPQPLSWFRNLLASMGHLAGISLVRHGNSAVAGILTLRHRDSVVYKYGCSDPAFHRHGAMQFALWNAIRQAKEGGAAVFDLGRSDLTDAGLIAFKDRWGAQRSLVTYLRTVAADRAPWMLSPARSTLGRFMLKHAAAHLPDKLLCAAGALAYRHVG